jgi:serine phosphatase RsbU (regulator of sigma subunit)
MARFSDDENGYAVSLATKSQAYRALEGAANARLTLQAGYTTVRDVENEGSGYADVALRDAIDEGLVEGPRMLVATRAIAAVGHYNPFGISPDLTGFPTGAQMVIGVEEARRAAREQLGHGADLLKVYADWNYPTLTVDEMRADIGFSPREIALIESIAASAALAIENARLYQTERHIADTLQRALLSLPDRVEGLAFAHAYRSASEAAFVGGDFYDLFEIERDLVGVLIGDVAGKGLDAAVLTQLLKNTVRAHALEKGGSPATILRLTNDIFFQVTSPDMFATAFFGVLDRSTGRLVYTNAGHTDAIIMRANGELVELPAESPLLGAFARRTFIQSEVDLKSNDLLLLYTDGVTEARSGSLLYGEERLMRNLARAGSRSPGSLVRAVVDDVLRFTAGRLSDDLAILVVQRLDGQAESPRVQQLEVSVT